jgi:membrane protease YdiL (CAAX protease family)
MIACLPLYALAMAAPVRLQPDWMDRVPGLFAQGGIAEEVVFRGYLFRHFRAGRGFWPAACLSAIPFVAVHLTLFASLDFAVALASLLVALSLSFPFAWLFERAGNSIWPPAILHFAVQGSIKPVDADGAGFLHLAIGWMILSAVAPWILLLMPGRSAGGRP